MKRMKKLFAILMTMAMVMGLSITGFAVSITGTPSANDEATITVQNVETNATVYAYQIVDAAYDDNGFTGYVPVQLITTDAAHTDLTVDDELAPSAEEVTAIANAIATGKLSITGEQLRINDDGNYTADVGAGYWLIIVNNTATTIYNPMLAGVAYANTDGTENTLEGGTIDADGDFVISDEVVYAKSSDAPTLEKEIAEGTYVVPENAYGNDVEIGDTVSFELTTTIPDYSDAYNNLTFQITDALSEGLTFVDDSFELNGAALPTGVTASVDGQTATISFTETYIKANGNATITITYDATVNENATVNFDANTNEAYITYTNNQGTTTSGDPVKTYHYTFALDGMLNGENGVDTIKTSEIIKVDEKGNVVNKVDTENKTSATVTGALGNATFQLYQKDGDGSIIQESIMTDTSDASGYFDFSGLEAGTYYLKETAAPAGYQLDSTEHTVVIEAAYNGDGTLDFYSVTIDGNRKSTYEATYEGETITKIDSYVGTAIIKNTTLTELPSTGGMGTTLFTIAGCVIMISAAGLFFATRKKAN